MAWGIMLQAEHSVGRPHGGLDETNLLCVRHCLANDLREIHANCPGDPQQGFKCRIPHAALHIAHHLLGQAGSLSHDVH
jgi:hypothetical protein